MLTWVIENKLSVYLSENPNAVPYLEAHPEKIDWVRLSKNPNAVPILEKNL